MGLQGGHKKVEQPEQRKQPLSECNRGLQELCSEPLLGVGAGLDLKQGVVAIVGHLLAIFVLLLLLAAPEAGREEGRVTRI